MSTETAFTRSKMIRTKYWEFLPTPYRPKYLTSEQQTGTLCRKMRPPYTTMCLLNWKVIFKDNICLLFKDAKWKLITSRFPETILLTTQKNLCSHTRNYIFAQWRILHDKKLPVQSQSNKRLKAQFITIVTGNSNCEKFFKIVQFRIGVSEVNTVLLWI